jgi:hypothetical protein
LRDWQRNWQCALHSVAGRMQKAPRSLTSRGFSDVAVKERFEPYPARCFFPLYLAIAQNYWLTGLQPTLLDRFNQLCFRQFFDS